MAVHESASNSECVFGNGFAQFDCSKALANPSYMTLVIKSQYTDTNTMWSKARMNECKTTTPSSVATKEFSTGCTVFVLGTLNAERLVLDVSQTSRYVDAGKVDAVTCTGCPPGRCPLCLEDSRSHIARRSNSYQQHTVPVQRADV